ncbi:hypothetical protein [Microbacterium maritypicum]|uniref:hypothetical protein n=1 Tax=Microbacterium maritypicum TaxID=33918 RepID=UPI003A8E3CD4
MTIIDTGSPIATEISGKVTTRVTLMRTIPERIPHASFGLESADHQRYAIHVTGPLAERTREAVHRGDRVTVTQGEAHHRLNAQLIDLDAADITVSIHSTSRTP